MISQRKMAWCSVSICSRVMMLVELQSGRVLLRVKWSVVSNAIVPHDYETKGESFCMAIRLNRRYRGNGGHCMFRCWHVMVRADATLLIVLRSGE